MGANDEQAMLWNGDSGRAWVEAQTVLDGMFARLETMLVDTVAESGATRVLDVGCGTGATTLAIARRIGAGAECLGLDISEPMIDVATERAREEGSPARFVCADAQVHDFESPRFDMIVSRFGVMFFDDPVAAFANLRRAAHDGAALRPLVWRGAEENPFMTTAERAAAPLLPAMPARDPDAPGQFAFADKSRVQGILEASGWGAIDIRPVDVECAIPESALVPYLTRFGPLARVLGSVDDVTRARIVDTARAAFDPFVHVDEVRFTAACWMVEASAGV
ncbi:class I SAM-dependent methyltransferase [Sphingomonas sp. JC676]|uniref:class I SAM-dependent methyltransferase n=1 Tax=Sphingomonas sp. JC676 TaxID=2768065 RepID=UPI00165782A5|nr:class I SAM-dependent methyltransferase [Sphingomonas sp. JC676]MBC9034205.1 class I SAM-dependent methyltransferase [Sphingomonas sp. JC676]